MTPSCGRGSCGTSHGVDTEPRRSAVSPFVAAWLPVVAQHLSAGPQRRRALDLAMGEGRHALALADAGFETFGVDRSLSRMQTACDAARDRGMSLNPWAADLDTYPLPRHWVDVLLCTRFLLRRRWAALKALVRPGGFVVYETFTVGQIARGRGPSSSDHLLEPGELLAAFGEWDVLFHEEVDEPAAVARLVARKPERS